jgi:hypothetical protein
MPTPTRAEIDQEFKKYFPGRRVSEEDYQAAEKSGLDIVSKSYGKITPGSPEGRQLATAQQQGAAASTTPSPTAPLGEQITATQNKMVQQTETKSDFLSLMQDALENQQKISAPYLQKEKQIKNKLITLPGQKAFKDMDPGTILRKRANQIGYWRNELDYIEKQRQEAEGNITQLAEQLRMGIEADIQASGMTLEQLMYQQGQEQYQAGLVTQAEQTAYQREQDAINFAFQPGILLSGVMPPGVPENMRRSWEEASNKAKEEEAYARRPRGGSGSGSAASKTTDFFMRNTGLGANAVEYLQRLGPDFANYYLINQSSRQDSGIGNGDPGKEIPYINSVYSQYQQQVASTEPRASDAQIQEQLGNLSPEDLADTAYVDSQIRKLGGNPADYQDEYGHYITP